MKKLILTVGLPRSGKSTWAMKQGFPVVNPDAIRLALHGKPYLQDAEDMVAVITHLMAKSLFIAGHEVVIIDATHNTQKRRDVWIKLFPDHDISLVNFDTSVEECIKRAIADDRKDLIPVIERMAKAEEPNKHFEEKENTD